MPSIRGADSDTGHYLVVVQLGKDWQLTISKKCDVQRFNLKKMSDLEFGKQYQIKISKRFVGLENLNDSEDINWA